MTDTKTANNESAQPKYAPSLVGLTFGMLLVYDYDPQRAKYGRRILRCRCACGRELALRRDKVVDPIHGRRSCGCTPRDIADQKSVYPLPLSDRQPGGRLLLPEQRHTPETNYLARAKNFARMFSPRGEEKDCRVTLSRDLTMTTLNYTLHIVCFVDDTTVHCTDTTVRRVFDRMLKILLKKGRTL